MGTGLTSGIDYTTMISQLMQIEAQPQTLLKTKLSNVQNDAAAYRDINSSFAALATAAQALTKADTWTAAKTTSSSTDVGATAGAGAQAGSLSFVVNKLATSHAVISAGKWADTTTAFGLASPLTVATSSGNKDITLADTDGNGTVSLAEAASSITASGLGLKATAVNTGSGYKLQISSSATGDASVFSLPSGSGFSVLQQGHDAEILIGDASAGSTTASFTVHSATNTFTGVMDGTTFTVGKADPSATVTLTTSTNADAVSNAVQAVVNAANAALAKVATSTDSTSGSAAPLKGDYSLIDLSGQILDAVSTAVGGKSAATVGLQLTKDGKVTFDANVFKNAFASDPAGVQKLLGGSTLVGADGTANSPDDTVDTDGLGARLAVLGDRASDSATGSLTSLANGQDSLVKDIQAQIDAWTLRLQQRKDTLTAQFTAMETALGTLQSQSTWLTSQINSLPKWSSSSN
jgi:flagellar hook-associated protein 2